MNDKYEQLLKRYENNESKIFFYVLHIDNYPLVSQWEAFYHAYVLRQKGIDAHILLDDSQLAEAIKSKESEIINLARKKADKSVIEELKSELDSMKDVFPKWIDSRFMEVPLIKTSEASDKVKISAIDMIVIPEHFKDVAFQLSKLPSKNVISVHNITSFFTQSVVNVGYIKDLNINTFITTSNSTAEIIKSNYHAEGNMYNVHVLPPTVPKYFKPAKLKAPKVAVFAKNEDDIKMIHKVFCTRYPSLSFVTFDVFNFMHREQFAKKLSEAAIGVMIDRKSSFGTFPLECLACNAYPIMLEPDYEIPYNNDRDGNDVVSYTFKLVSRPDENGRYNDIPEMIYNAIIHYLNNGVYHEFFDDAMAANIDLFETKAKENDILAVYKSILDSRYEDIKKMIKKDE